jgi:hypothetical protein
MPVFDPKSSPVGFVVDKLALGQVAVTVRHRFAVSDIPAIIHTPPTLYSMILTNENTSLNKTFQ